MTQEHLAVPTVLSILRLSEALVSIMGRASSLKRESVEYEVEEDPELGGDGEQVLAFYDKCVELSAKQADLPSGVYVSSLIAAVMDESMAEARRLLNLFRNVKTLSLAEISQAYTFLDDEDADDGFKVVERCFEKAQLDTLRTKPVVTIQDIMYATAMLVAETRWGRGWLEE